MALTGDQDVCLNGSDEIRIRTCAGTYEPISHCYWDTVFGHRTHVPENNRKLLIDAGNPVTQKLIRWIGQHGEFKFLSLRGSTKMEMDGELEAIKDTPELSALLDPWKELADDLMREDSLLAERLQELNPSLVTEKFEIVPVNNIRAQFLIPDIDEMITQEAKWDGPQALGDASSKRIYVRPPTLRPGSLVEKTDVDSLDKAIATEMAILCSGDDRRIITDLGQCINAIRDHLERPQMLLNRLAKEASEAIFFQYQDQNADPDFNQLYRDRNKTKEGAKRKELETKMSKHIATHYVSSRREQIEGHGYNKFSVFAELLQNADDAYIQRSHLVMKMPQPCYITFRHLERNGVPCLVIEHGGRPFNYWKHDAKQDILWKEDIQRLLASLGSFKTKPANPGKGMPEVSTTGRFGLGFKSVYLLTDRPEIYSGAFHFCIEAAHIAKELPRPKDLGSGVTRISLPLRADAGNLQDGWKPQNLLPFLQKVTKLTLDGTNDATSTFTITAEKLTSNETHIIEKVIISNGREDGDLCFIRCRSSEHSGQMAVLLYRDGTPARWLNAFTKDLYVTLPLESKLHCGIAVSNSFKLESGRTHLVKHNTNEPLIREVVALLRGLVDGLREQANASTPLADILHRFWALWRWERVEDECANLNRALAKQLVKLAGQHEIVPTLDSDCPTSLSAGYCFKVSELPDPFKMAIIDVGLTIHIPEDNDIPLTMKNVVDDRFFTTFQQTCEYANVQPDHTITKIGWEEVGSSLIQNPWLADHPHVLDSLSGSLNPGEKEEVAEWIAESHVLGKNIDGKHVHSTPNKLLDPEFCGHEHISRFRSDKLSEEYSKDSRDLLKLAGMLEQPTPESIEQWIKLDDFEESDGKGILRYLLEGNRFISYKDLKHFFRTTWFPASPKRITLAEAVNRELIPKDILDNDEFKEWLGLEASETEPEEPEPPRLDPAEVLTKLFDWWGNKGAAWTSDYEIEVYPDGRPPNLQTIFQPHDLESRREWMSLFIIAVLQNMGRTKPTQHRNFLILCKDKGWLDVFVEENHDAHQWLNILKQYLDSDQDTQNSESTGFFYNWVRRYPDFLQLSMRLTDYVNAFLAINHYTAPFPLDQIISPRTNPSFSGGGPDAPSLDRVVGDLGASFIVRELMRLEVLNQHHANPYCYVPALRVRRLLGNLGCQGLESLRHKKDRSPIIYRFLKKHLKEERATFGRSFDLPLLALNDDPELRKELLGPSVYLE